MLISDLGKLAINIYIVLKKEYKKILFLIPYNFKSNDEIQINEKIKVSEMQNLSMVFKSNFDYNHRVEHKKLL